MGKSQKAILLPKISVWITGRRGIIRRISKRKEMRKEKFILKPWAL